jgi:DNA invertase Pin-like site-specific DNA recombinase
MDIGYCRVSTQGQTLESQIEQLQKAGCSKIHSEKPAVSAMTEPNYGAS